MADLNMTYGAQSKAAVAGMAADSGRLTDDVSKFAATALAAGKFVKLSDAANNPTKVGLVDAADDKALGVTRWVPTIITPEAVSLATYGAEDQVSVFTSGRIHVNCVKAAVAGTKAYAVISGANQGDVTDTAGGTTTTAAVGLFTNTTAAAGLQVVELIKSL